MNYEWNCNEENVALLREYINNKKNTKVISGITLTELSINSNFSRMSVHQALEKDIDLWDDTTKYFIKKVINMLFNREYIMTYECAVHKRLYYYILLSEYCNLRTSNLRTSNLRTSNLRTSNLRTSINYDQDFDDVLHEMFDCVAGGNTDIISEYNIHITCEQFKAAHYRINDSIISYFPKKYFEFLYNGIKSYEKDNNEPYDERLNVLKEKLDEVQKMIECC